MEAEREGARQYQHELQRKLENLGIDCSAGVERALAAFRKKYKVGEGGEWDALSKRGGYTFSEVLQYELDALEGDRKPESKPASLEDVHARAHAARLAGLAFSGGGIRSATFNLGVIQGLAQMKLLRHFDYLSTVSGGGYIGGWLSKWIATSGGDVRKVEEELAGKEDGRLPRKQPWQVQFLRRYSNYLTPKTGLFSADTWTVICTYLRNTGLNMIILFAWLALLFLLPRLVLHGMPATVEQARSTWWIAAAIFPFLWVVFWIALSISRRGRLPAKGWGAQSQPAVLLRICVPLMVAGFAGAVAVWGHRVPMARYWNGLPSSLIDSASGWLVAPGLLYIGAWFMGWATARRLNRTSLVGTGHTESPRQLRSQMGGHFASAVTALTVGTILLLKAVSAAVACERIPWDSMINPVALASFGMPAMLFLFGVTVTLMIGLIGRLYRDQSREWWARYGAWIVICAGCWLLVFGSAFYLPPLLHYAWDSGAIATAATAGLTALATAVGLKAGSGKATGGPDAPRYKEWIAQVAPYAFMLLTVAILTTVLHWLVTPMPAEESAGARRATLTVVDYLSAFQLQSMPEPGALWTLEKPRDVAIGLLPLVLGLLIGALVLGWRVDVNKFSLYMMYRLRLVRAYFGASSTQRMPHPFTGFDPEDDCKLAELFEQKSKDPAAAFAVQRPIHLINATVNMVGGKELAWQTRKAGGFCFSPAFCGFELPQMPPDGSRSHSPRGAYRPTDRYGSRTPIFKDDDAGVHLGMAVAVSGAAASPNMGYHSSPPLSFLMTLFNLRLGRWSANPVKEHVWEQAAPRLGIASILSELFGLTDTTARFLYLSDGGHFENLGLYELVRRRCRLIVVVDASADGKYEFGDLGNAIRKCQTDFNISILLSTSKIRGSDATPGNAVSFLTGKVRYSQADGPDAQDGVLLYIKPIILGNENADILNYSKTHPGFPHQSTADQWFDEDQFESYRMLGQSSAGAALRPIAVSLDKAFEDRAVDPADRKRCIEHICSELYVQGGGRPG